MPPATVSPASYPPVAAKQFASLYGGLDGCLGKRKREDKPVGLAGARDVSEQIHILLQDIESAMQSVLNLPPEVALSMKRAQDNLLQANLSLGPAMLEANKGLDAIAVPQEKDAEPDNTKTPGEMQHLTDPAKYLQTDRRPEYTSICGRNMDEFARRMKAVDESYAKFKDHAKAAARFVKHRRVPGHPLFAAQSFAEARYDAKALQTTMDSLSEKVEKGVRALHENLTADQFYGPLLPDEEYADMDKKSNP